MRNSDEDDYFCNAAFLFVCEQLKKDEPRLIRTRTPCYQADLATGRERQLTKGKRAERTKHDFRCSICRSAIGQASCLICARRYISTDVPVLLLSQPNLLGSLSNDDGDGNENGKKSNSFMLAKQFRVFSRTTTTFFFFP